MSNNYTPTTWVGGKTVGTANVMNNIEQGIVLAHNRFEEPDIANPVYINTLNSPTSSVMQCFMVLSNGNYVFSQVVSEESGKESFVVNLCDNHGKFISSMKITEGGHGVITGYEDGSQIFIMFTDSNGVLRKCTYIGGSTISVNEAMEIPKYSSEYQLININKELNLISVCNKNTQKKYYSAHIYNFDEYLSGSATPVYSIDNIIGDTQTLQGFGCDDKYFYAYTGAPGESLIIRKHDLTSQTYEDVNINISSPTILEGEGLFINGYDMYLGIAKGEPSVLRSNDIYAISSLDNFISNFANVINNSQTYQLCEGDGTSKAIILPSKLSEITSPGMYYFTATQFGSFLDKPSDYDSISSGFFLSISSKSKDGAIIQELTRNTTSTNPYKRIRRVGLDSVSEWKPVIPEMRNLLTRDTRAETTVTLPDSLWNYDILIFQVWSPNGKWNNATVPKSMLQAEKKIIFNGLNIGDSSTSKIVYAFELQIEIDDTGKILTQTIKSEVLITGSAENTRRECSVGVYNIQGIKGINILPNL